MTLLRNTITGAHQTAFGATVNFLKNKGEGVWVEVDTAPVDELKGQALKDALKANKLSSTGNVDEQKARLRDHLANQANSAGGFAEPNVVNPDGPNLVDDDQDNPDLTQGQ